MKLADAVYLEIPPALSTDLVQPLQTIRKILIVAELPRQLEQERLQGVVLLHAELGLRLLQPLLQLHLGRGVDVVVEQHRKTHLQHQPNRDDGVEGREERDGPVAGPVRVPARQRVGPGLARRHEEEGVEGHVEHVEVVGRHVPEAAHPDDRTCHSPRRHVRATAVQMCRERGGETKRQAR